MFSKQQDPPPEHMVYYVMNLIKGTMTLPDIENSIIKLFGNPKQGI